MFGQLGRGDLVRPVTDTHVGEHADARIAVEQVEAVQHALGTRMIGGHTGAHQATGSGQPVDNGDIGLGPVEQRTQRVAARRSGAHKRDPQSHRKFRDLRVGDAGPVVVGAPVGAYPDWMSGLLL